MAPSTQPGTALSGPGSLGPKVTSSLDFPAAGFWNKVARRLHLTENRNLFWSWYEPRNFGDWVGPYLFEKITGNRPSYLSPAHMHNHRCFFAAGSILRRVTAPDRAVIWGSGIISREDQIARPAQTLAVRGPRSRARLLELGYDCPPVYGDPGLLLSRFFMPERQPNGIALIPHFTEHAAVAAAAPKGVRVIDVCGSVEDVAAQIASADVTISSSLHGLIVSHSYGVPSVWINSDKPLMGDDSKFHDYFESLGVTGVEPQKLDLSAGLRGIEALAATAFCPDISGLAETLLRVCPFSPRRWA